jgi:Phosphotransferase enzyme family
MTFLLSTENVCKYLFDQDVYQQLEIKPQQINSISCKNFNLSIQFEGQHFLVKQECHNAEGKTRGEVANEWRIHQFLESFPEVESLRSLLPEVIHFDPESSILVSHYFSGSCDLDEFYQETGSYSAAIAQSLALVLAKLHRTTFNIDSYRDFFARSDRSILRTPRIFNGSVRLKPEIFGTWCEDGMEFWRLYQRYESLREAIDRLRQDWQPCCLIHNDLKLNNILIQRAWGEAVAAEASAPFQEGAIRLIDWERFLWGDPAFDVATVLASYLRIWLKSLMIGTELDLDMALRLATTPLERLQPSLVAFMQTYLQHAPAVLGHATTNPAFLRRTMQMTGLCLIQRIQAKLDYREPFGNSEICMLQVAKSLLCQPDESIPAIFGVAAF